jgi:hypothetical protein
MECSVIDERYMDQGVTPEAFNVFKALKDECRKYGGDFTLLWHNDRLIDNRERELYLSVLQAR